MMLHVAQLWEVIMKITSLLVKEKLSNYPHFKVDQINIKKEKHSEKKTINVKKKKNKKKNLAMTK